MPASVYDINYRRYKLHRRLKPKLEALAAAIAASGRLRIDDDESTNFVRLLLPEERVDATFSRREVTDPGLLEKSKMRLLEILLSRHDAHQAQKLTARYIERVQEDIKRKAHVSARIELMMARALVLCNEPEVIELIHCEGAEIFISFGHSVGDVMDVARWAEMGKNSGLQAVGAGENAIYVSCGGHPFLDKEEYRHSGDGPSALARFMIIAAQETGHNADMIRDEQGRWAGRFSAVGWGRAPSAVAGKGRISDINNTQQLYDFCLRAGLLRIRRWEEHLQFYRDKKLWGHRRALAWLLARGSWLGFSLWLWSHGHAQLRALQRSQYPATLLAIFFPDMLANLTPVADVYRRNNPQEEEAIACIEAVARVPQQVIKWGKVAVQYTTPSLYRIYYGEIVPACRKALRLRSTNVHSFLHY